MNTEDLVEILAARTSDTHEVAAGAIHALIGVLTEALVRGERVDLGDLGRFDVLVRPALGGARLVVFRASRATDERLNGPRDPLRVVGSWVASGPWRCHHLVFRPDGSATWSVAEPSELHVAQFRWAVEDGSVMIDGFSWEPANRGDLPGLGGPLEWEVPDNDVLLIMATPGVALARL